MKNGKRLNILYGAQVATRPPRFRITVNDRRLVTRDYAYWVENQLREQFELEGVPVTIDFIPAAERLWTNSHTFVTPRVRPCRSGPA